MKKLILPFLLILIQCNIGQSQNVSCQNQYAFIENKGQVYDQNYKKNNSVKYILPLNNGMNIQLKQNSFSYDTYYKNFEQNESPDKNEIQFHRIDIELVGANINPEIIADEKTADYLNFYNTVTPKDGAINVRQFKRIIYKNIYPGIDLVFVSQPSKTKPVEYSFIVNPGADPQKIKIKYKGALNAKLLDGKVCLTLKQGILSESIPGCWIKGNYTSIDVKYREITTKDNEFVVEFQFPENINEILNKSTLIIDPVPNIEWGTYYGGNADEYGWSIITDQFDNSYTTGSTSSVNAIATTGAQQTVLGGLQDIFIVKMHSDGTRNWGSYYGGSGSDIAYSIRFDNDKNLILTGRTSSASNFATIGSHQSIYGGNGDAFILKIDSLGMLQWCTYYGGTSQDEGCGLITDDSSNIYMVGNTYSSTNISIPSSYQTSIGGDQDVFLVKFSPNGIRIWSTYYGGALKDWATYNSIVVDTNRNAYITGTTASTSSIATVGSHQQSYGGGAYDSFISRFGQNGMLYWASYYGGDDEEGSGSIAIDNQEMLYISGLTLSASNIGTPGAYQENSGGYVDAYVAKFNSGGVRQWGSYYGGSNYDAGFGVNVDINNNVYLGGWTKSLTNIASPGAYQTGFAGGVWDAFLVKFNSSGSRLWGSYYGGEQDDFCYSIYSYNGSSIFITGETWSQTGISTPNGHQISLNLQDAFIAKFYDCSDLLAPGFIQGNDSLCEGDTAYYSVPLYAGASLYNWTVPSGSTILSGQGTTSVIIHFGSNSGPVEVTTTTSCGISAAQIKNISVFPIPIASAGNNDTICLGDSIILNASGGDSYSWYPTTGLNDPNVANPTASPSSTMVYTLTASNALGCTSTDQVYIEVLPIPDITCLGNDTIICVTAASMPNITLSCMGFAQCLWTSSTGECSNSDSIVIDNSGLTFGQGIKTVTLQVTDDGGCISADSIQIEFKSCESIEEYGDDCYFEVYPNPVNDYITIESSKPIKEAIVKFYTAQGHIILEKRLIDIKTEFDVGGLVSGVYFVKVENFEGYIVKKFVKE